jgi:hypothetical protein
MSRKFRIIKISSTTSGFIDRFRFFFKTRLDELRIHSDVAELVGVPNNDFSNKAGFRNIRECLFLHPNNVSSFENAILVLRELSTSPKSSSELSSAYSFCMILQKTSIYDVQNLSQVDRLRHSYSATSPVKIFVT